MTSKKKEPTDWDKAFEFVKDAPEFNIEDATCTLIKPMPEVGEMPEEVWETLLGPTKDTKDK